MTSFGCKLIRQHGWDPSFRVQGQVFHLIGALEPHLQEKAEFLQIYFLDSEMDQVHRRLSLLDCKLRESVVLLIQTVLQDYNKYIRMLRATYEMATRNYSEFKIVIKEDERPIAEHARRYNAQEVSEVAILMPNMPVGHRDIVLHQRDNQLKRICELHLAYDPLQYPLLFPRGTHGWSIQMKLSFKISQNQFYCFHFMTREGNYILHARRLFQQFMVDAYAKIETERLQFLRREQSQLRADSYQELKDSLSHHDANPNQVGQRVVLPSTFTGGPRYMLERQQDAMTYVRTFGRPYLFITVTTNPNWPEIKNHLSPGQTAADRPDLVVRVFRQKMKCVVQFFKEGVFGAVQAWLYFIEFQKRGLPYAHVLLWLDKNCKITPELIDNAVSAEIPDRNTDPILFDLVVKHIIMVHGPCSSNNSSVSIKDGKCTKRFPRPFSSETVVGHDGYPLYKRRHHSDGGQKVTMKVRNRDISLDNSWIVPYNSWLLRHLQCHVNFELCMSVKSIKCVLKYVHKGSDQATFQLQNSHQDDEISQFQNARYIGSTEAAWRVFEFPIHERFPPVLQLAVHLENGQRVYFTASNAHQIATSDPPATTLTKFFQLCQQDPFAARQFYCDIPKFYTWDRSKKQWKKRKMGQMNDAATDTRDAPMIGRVYTGSPKQTECFFLRILLHHVKGPTSFHALKTFEGNQYETFREACLARGLLEDDNVHVHTLQEAAISCTAFQMRNLFSIILVYCNPSDPPALWDQFAPALSEDISHNNVEISVTDCHNQALIFIEDSVVGAGGLLLENYGLPSPQRDSTLPFGSRETYNVHDEQSTALHNVAKLTPDQLNAFKRVLCSVDSQQGGLFFLDAPGGCGKTFLLKTLLADVRSKNKIAIATAGSGLAATLLPGGRTVHSTFKVPLNVAFQEQQMCSIKRGTALSKRLCEVFFIVIDEAPMLHKKVFEAIDFTLHDIRNCDKLMGGVTTLLCGDFRQILPVVLRGTRANIVDACLKKSALWSSMSVFRLTTNLRVLLNSTDEATTFSEKLLKVGNGSCQIVQQPDTISLTELGTVVTTLISLIDCVFPDFEANISNHNWLAQRAILAPLNETTDEINRMLSERISQPPTIYSSVDTTVSDEDALHYSTEFLNSIEISGLPPHTLSLKIGMPVMILRSLNPPKLMNGTRCVVTRLLQNTVEVEISSGEKHIIPRISLQPSESMLPFTFQRRQFPLRPCFSVTINKAQGQTLKTVGLDLRRPVFSHGMLYVALSRTGDKSSTFVLAPDGKTKNIVFQEVL